MLDAYIIDQLKKREEKHRKKDAERPRLEIPADDPARRRKKDEPPTDEHSDEGNEKKRDQPERGVVIIEVRS
ncbi:MAG: hypothetical protein HYY84_17835 [Deltaproteobacteria bacterium]|nr:hypothetical protein [Deltaproteobacteria bacterium]